MSRSHVLAPRPWREIRRLQLLRTRDNRIGPFDARESEGGPRRPLTFRYSLSTCFAAWPTSRSSAKGCRQDARRRGAHEHARSNQRGRRRGDGGEDRRHRKAAEADEQHATTPEAVREPAAHQQQTGQAHRKPSSTHCSSPMPAPRSRDMSGNATFTIVVSTALKNIDTHSTPRPHQRRAGAPTPSSSLTYVRKCRCSIRKLYAMGGRSIGPSRGAAALPTTPCRAEQ